MHKFLNLFVKSGKFLTVSKEAPNISKFTCKYVDKVANGTKNPVIETKAAIGDASIWIEGVLSNKVTNATAEVKNFFKGIDSIDVDKDIFSRSKSALSIETKLMRGLKKTDGKTFHSIEEAMNVIGDGIGSRVITKPLRKLSEAEIDDMIKNLVYEGKKLKPKEAKALKKYIYSPTQTCPNTKTFKLYEAFAKPLIEERSKEVVDRLTLGILKHRQMFEGLDIKDLQAKGLFDEKLLKQLNNKDIVPIQITQINNYRGTHGLPEFTNSQIQQLSRALNYKNNGEKIIVASDVRGLDDFLYSQKDIADYSGKAIKASGYRTAQMNVIHENGALGEIQFRGPMTNLIGEYEHIAYDLRQGKNTLGPIFDDFAKAVSKLNDREYNIYNQYLEQCYNYYNKIELGLPAFKPKLPSRFPKILSEDSMKALHDKAELLEKTINRNFKKHYAAVA